jgi:NAD(P)H-dependent FMN reductase
VLIVLDDLGWSHAGLIRIATELASCPPLAQAAKMALHTAGATADVPGSPMPPGVSVNLRLLS